MEFTRTPEYDALLISRPTGEYLEDAWRQLSTTPAYNPNLTKATTLLTPALQYIHFVLNHTLTGRGDSAGVVSHRDFDFLLSMVDGFHLYLDYEVAISISHQGTDPRINTLFVGPYITRLVRRLGILEGANKIRIVGGVASMTLEILRSMGILQCVQTPRGAEYKVKQHIDPSSTAAADILPAGDPAPSSPPHTTIAYQRSRSPPCNLSSYLDQVTCSSATFKLV